MYFHQQGVIVAVQLDVDQMQHIPTGFSFCPKTLTATAPKGHQPCVHGLFIGLLVHIAQHEHLQGAGILYDGRHQPVTLVKVYIHNLTFMFSF